MQLGVISPSNALLIAHASFFRTTYGALVSFKIGFMVSQMVAYDSMTGSLPLFSLTLTTSMAGSIGCQLKASAALLVLPNLYWM